ncbi:ferritin family protein [Desulforhopalus singaporensis]|uniref:Rubrerythrin n=1 Tax=Desulforhopalus singaporensis TaxID=91360 RepID=A0A1H0JZ69_9BACT|nr:ferritin family protein [Desulforhopalus singaporensis]SDO48954.1 Rubrerythrin [Desulforhopalus singaporensis]
MTSQEIFTSALVYERKIRDLYRQAVTVIDDRRGRQIFDALARDEQSHVDFLEYSLEQLKKNDNIDIEKLQTPIPTRKQIEADVDKLRTAIPEKMLGDVKRVLASALKLEKETSAFYRDACAKTEGEIESILKKFLDIEERHVDVVQIELDHASNSGLWFNFMEVDLEA